MSNVKNFGAKGDGSSDATRWPCSMFQHVRGLITTEHSELAALRLGGFA